MQSLNNLDLTAARRTFLARSALGLGSVALAGLLPSDKGLAAAPTPNYAGLNDLPHFAPRAKRVIFLCMAGGPSHLETFDYKEQLEKMHGEPMPDSITQGQPIAQLQGQELHLDEKFTQTTIMHTETIYRSTLRRHTNGHERSEYFRRIFVHLGIFVYLPLDPAPSQTFLLYQLLAIFISSF